MLKLQEYVESRSKVSDPLCELIAKDEFEGRGFACTSCFGSLVRQVLDCLCVGFSLSAACNVRPLKGKLLNSKMPKP